MENPAVDAAMLEFQLSSYAQQVIFGPGSLARLGEAVDALGWRRLMLCTSASARGRGHVGPVEAALGERLVATYERVLPHVQDRQVAEAAAAAAERQVRAVIGLGGGSAIGLAKAVAAALSGGRASAAPADDPPPVAVVAIPTTYAGSEMTPIYGVTTHAEGAARKVTVSDARVTPRLTLYDPSLALDLSPEMTAATGINALAHCIEALYSIRRNPLATAAAVGGVRHITRALPRCYADGRDLQARAEMFMGSYLAGAALATVAMGLHHGLCHVLGGAAGVPHGVANGIILPHAMRFNLDSTAPQLAQAAWAMGIAPDGGEPEAAAEAAVRKVTELIGQLNLPQHLRDAGVAESDLPRLAQLALQSRAVQSNPKPIADAAQIEAVLRAAW